MFHLSSLLSLYIWRTLVKLTIGVMILIRERIVKIWEDVKKFKTSLHPFINREIQYLILSKHNFPDPRAEQNFSIPKSIYAIVTSLTSQTVHSLHNKLSGSTLDIRIWSSIETYYGYTKVKP